MISFVLIEAGLRIFNPVEMRLRGDQVHLPFFKHYEIKVNAGGKLDPVITHTRNSLGFRGQGLPKDWSSRLTILAIGGSTTENFYISDGNTWPELLGGHLKKAFDGVWINNAGLLGHSTYGHIHLVRQYVDRTSPQNSPIPYRNKRQGENRNHVDRRVHGKRPARSRSKDQGVLVRQ